MLSQNNGMLAILEYCKTYFDERYFGKTSQTVTNRNTVTIRLTTKTIGIETEK